MLHNECKAVFSQFFPVWDKLNANEQNILCSHTVTKKYKSGNNIHGKTSACTGAILLKSGSARTYILSPDGKEITLYRLFPGDICMLSASCVLQSIAFDVFVDAAEDCECYIISGNAIAEVSQNNLHVQNFALNSAVSRFSDVMWVMQQILFMSFDKRLALFLYNESERTNSNTIYLTHDKIAAYLGSAREVVSRMLKYFESEGIVERCRGGIKITDKQKLKAKGNDAAAD